MPEWKDEIKTRLADLRLEPAREAEIVEELSEHLSDRFEELLLAGLDEREARATVLSELSDNHLLVKELEQVERIVRREPVVLGTWRSNMFKDIWQDLIYALRMFRKQPGFTFIAVLTLALGIGPVTAIFTLVHAVLFRPLPYKEPERLVRVYKNTNTSASVPDFVDMRDGNRVFDGVGTFSIYSVFNLVGEGEPVAIQGSIVSANLLATLGVEPLMGRWFLADEDKPGASPVVVLSHKLWQERFNADPSIIGRKLTFDARIYTVVGVMPAGFEFPIVPSGTQIWANAIFDPADPTTPRTDNFLNVIARLKSGVTFEQAASELETILQPNYPDQIRVSLMPLHEQLVEDTRTPLLVLLIAITFVLLIACSNVANLLMIRAAARQKEMAIRAALGASQARLFRQLLVESILLAGAGGVAGLLLGLWSLDFLISISPINLPRVAEIAIDGRILTLLSLVVVATGILFGTLSSFRLSDKALREALKEGAGRTSGTRARARLRSTLVTAEIALSLVLLIGTGLMLKSFIKLQSVDPGLKSEGVLCVNVTVPESRYPDESQQAAFIEQVVERLEALPEARSVASAAYFPWTMATASPRFAIEGLPLSESGKEPVTNYISISPEYFRTLGVALAAGRAFTLRDDNQASPVAIVNQTFVRRFFQGEEVLGKRIRLHDSEDEQPRWLEIVGVAGDIRQRGPAFEALPEVYTPLSQSAFRFMTFFVSTDGDPLRLAGAARSAIQTIDKDQPVAWVATLDQILDGSVRERRGLMFLLAVFAAVASLLAAVGVYGVISNSVAQRTHEIGIRMALGATSRDVLELILRQAMKLVLAGVGLGLVGAQLLTSFMSSELFEVSPTDLMTFASVPLVLATVALVACYIPARRASRVDPMIALRCE